MYVYMHVLLCRPTYMSTNLCFTTDSFFLSFFRRLISELAERNSTNKIVHMLRSKCDLKTRVQNMGQPLPLKAGATKPHILRLSNLTVTLTAYIFGMKHDIDNRASALTTRGLLRRLKTTWTLVHKRLQTGPPFLPTLSTFCILAISLPCFADEDQQTELNHTMPNGGR